MLLRNSISNAKKFFHKTLQNFKSCFSPATYQKLPKKPTHPTSHSKPLASDQMSTKQERHDPVITSTVKNYQIQRRSDNSSSKRHLTRDQGRVRSVGEKLKELEKMDKSNVDHVLDIEEVMHYYSRLTCPAYLDIVDKFFMDMYAEFLAFSATTPQSVNSRPRLQSVMRMR